MKTENSRDLKIAAQSNLKLINEWAANCGYCITLKEMVAICNVMNDYVEYGYSKELGDRLDSIDTYIKYNQHQNGENSED